MDEGKVMPTNPSNARVTPRAQKAYEMRREGQTWDEIAAVLGVKRETAKAYAGLCVSHGKDALRVFHEAKPEVVNPEKTAEMIDLAMTERGLDRGKFLEMAAACGMPAKVAHGLMGRIRASYGAIYKEVKLLKGKALADELTGKISKLLGYLDDYTMSQMSGKDLMIAVGIAVEKVQLLEGRPTAIYDVNMSARLEVQMTAMLSEAKRRGLTLDVTAEQNAEAVKV